jgi:hypothetical protein
VEIHKKIGAVYGDIMYWENVTNGFVNWLNGGLMFEQRSSRPSLISDDLRKTEEFCVN